MDQLPKDLTDVISPACSYGTRSQISKWTSSCSESSKDLAADLFLWYIPAYLQRCQLFAWRWRQLLKIHLVYPLSLLTQQMFLSIHALEQPPPSSRSDYTVSKTLEHQVSDAPDPCSLWHSERYIPYAALVHHYDWRKGGEMRTYCHGSWLCSFIPEWCVCVHCGLLEPVLLFRPTKIHKQANKQDSLFITWTNILSHSQVSSHHTCYY